MAQYVIRVVRQAGLAVAFVAAALLGILSGVLFAYAGDVPEIRGLDNYAPSTITRVYASGGEVIGEFATERRVVLDHDAIGQTLRQAILATEDADFDRHFGLSIPRIIITAIRDIVYGERAGASTLTQQLARLLFLREYMVGGGVFERSLERKIKEAIVAIQIEKRYTKREIFTLYCNQIYLGHGAYGVEAAARYYFDKHAADLALEEAALIAGIIQAPERLSPFASEERARRRRNYVLDRMATENFITREQAEAAKAAPIVLRNRPADDRGIAPYFVEEVRKYLEAKYGADRLYEDGLAVQTPLDVRLQRAANAAVDAGLRQIDRRRGYRKPTRNVLAEGGSIEGHREDRWRRAMAAGDIVPAVVTSVAPDRAALRIGPLNAALPAERMAWTRQRSPAALFRPGDLIEVRLVEVDAGSGVATVELEQTPLVEGALLALENRTGRILAMVGGYSFDRSKFNRATQASRQLGSLFKAVLYTAAVDRGYTPVAILQDQPVRFNVGPNQPPYAPSNYDHTFEGPVTLRHALEKSRNIPAVLLMDQLGPSEVIGYARRLGIDSELPPVLSLALGAGEATLEEITSAYSVFPNQGVRMIPHEVLRITDREGNVLEENRPRAVDAIRADTAYVMTSLLRGVVQRGTAAGRAGSLDWPLAGKTGTVDDYTDAWFVGFDPDITVGVWVGHDEKKTLGNGEEGARAALPIWVDFMRAYIEGRDEKPEFSAPGNIVFLDVDRYTGQVGGGNATIREAFIAGTQPGVGFPR